MKNSTPIKSALLLTVLMLGTLLLVASCNDNSTADTKETAENRNNIKVMDDAQTIQVMNRDNDTKFLMDAAEMQLEEISLGQLAQEKGRTSHVKDLGKAMEKDHAKSLASLRTLAQAKSVAIPATITDDTKEAYKKLNEKTGNDFDKAYSAMIVENHENAIELFERTSQDSKDPEIRTLASNMLPSLRSHLQHAEKCKRECEKLKS
jgi:putative membrane protein